MQLLVDTRNLTLLSVGVPEEVLDKESGKQRLDTEGKPIFVVRLVAMADGRAEVIPVKVSGATSGVTSGIPVRVTGLKLTPWSMGDRSGISYGAERIEPASPQSRSNA